MNTDQLNNIIVKTVSKNFELENTVLELKERNKVLESKVVELEDAHFKEVMLLKQINIHYSDSLRVEEEKRKKAEKDSSDYKHLAEFYVGELHRVMDENKKYSGPFELFMQARKKEEEEDVDKYCKNLDSLLRHQQLKRERNNKK
jgi:hypothetical protein